MGNTAYISIISGNEEPLPVFASIVRSLEHLEEFPFLVEPIYREAVQLNEVQTDRLRFGLIRLQLYADIHRYDDMETAQKMKYVAQVLERVIFGGLLLEGEEPVEKCSCGY
ncbi:MAG: hypothetical protein KO206_02615 [Methanomicrobiaceae archaeon]|nr:hypothetical protein [Methanomicrobiaceae archaeon]MDD5419383.1 hypothetical protein [Methanomicrobiaceae archaeon]